VGHKTVFFDIETTGLDPWEDRIITFQYSLDGGPTEVIDCRKGIPAPIRRMMEDPAPLKVGHNAAFDMTFLQVAAGMKIRNVWDTMLAERILTLGRASSTDLPTLSRKYTTMPLPPKERGRSFKDISYGVLPDWAVEYARRDVEVLPQILQVQKNSLETDGLTRIAKLEFDLVPVIVGMQCEGVLLDRLMWEGVISDLQKRKRLLEMKLDGLAGVSSEQTFLFAEAAAGLINWQSHVQILAALHRNGVDVDGTAEKVLQAYLRNHPKNDLVRTLLFYKGIVGLSRFDLPKHVSQRTGRIHPHYDQLGARSGRTSCSDPNLQNVPNPKQEFQKNLGIDLRKCVVPRPGYVFVEADYSQIELRIMAELSGEALMLDAFINNRDLHLETARAIFEDPDIQSGDVKRRYAKSANFCIVYGGGSEKLADLLGISSDEGRAIINGIYRAFPGIQPWKKTMQDNAFRYKFARTIWGRRRYFQEARNKEEESFLKRMAVNTPVQGAAADLAKRALIRVSRAVPEAPIVLFVHDEIVVEAPEERAEEVKQIVEREMIAAGEEMLVNVPVKVDIEIRRNWGMADGS